MFSKSFRFTVEIKNSGFTSPDDTSYPRTAVMTIISLEGHHEMVKTFGYLEEEEIFQLIDNGSPLCLDYCYIDKFSLTDYRNQRGLLKKQYINIRDCRVRHAFFDSQEPVDFSFAEFSGTEVTFEGTYFAKKSISLHSSHFISNGLNFSKVRTAIGDMDFTNIVIEKGDVTFKNSHFGPGDVNFHDAELGTGNIDFTNTIFGEGNVSFVNTRFGDGDVSFKVAIFGKGRVDFHYAKFAGGDISFERTEFGEGRKDFRTVEFGTGRVNFNRAIFGNGDVSFEASQLRSGKISFKRTEFGTGRIDFELGEYENVEASFERAVFGEGSISFHNSKFRTLCLASCHFNHYLDLRIAGCEYIDLSDTIVRDIIDLKPYDFDIKVNRINFSGMRLIGRLFIDWEANRVRSLIMNQQDTSKRLKAEQFRTLKENFRNTGQYNDEDKAYVEFKRMESEASLEESLKRNRYNLIWIYPVFGFKKLVFDWAGRYATDPLRVIISMGIIYTFYSLLLMLLVLITGSEIYGSAPDVDQMSLAAKSFYYCAVSFLTIGYGDFFPLGSLRPMAGVIGFTGLFLMSYFTVAFVRKILR